jgi:hypothetical protein
MQTGLSKRAATNHVNACKYYFSDLVFEVLTQHPQPNGTIWLYGEVITKRRIKEASAMLTEAINERKALDKK